MKKSSVFYDAENRKNTSALNDFSSSNHKKLNLLVNMGFPIIFRGEFL